MTPMMQKLRQNLLEYSFITIPIAGLLAALLVVVLIFVCGSHC